MSDGGDTLQIAQPQSKKVHPFFVAPKSLQKSTDTAFITPVTPDPSCSPGSDKGLERLEQDDGQNEVSYEPSDGDGRRKRRKTDSDTGAMKVPANGGGRRGRKPRASAGSSIVDHFGQPPNTFDGGVPGTTLQNALDHHEPTTTTPLAHEIDEATKTSAEKMEPASGGKAVDVVQDEGPSKKILKFNPKTGTIGSPPKPKPSTSSAMDTTPPKAGAKRGRKPKSLVVNIYYGTDDDSRMLIGDKIADIFNGSHRVSARGRSKHQAVLVPPEPEQKCQKLPVVGNPAKNPPAASTKATHPFFMGKPKTNDGAQSEQNSSAVKSPSKRQTIFTSKPCSPKHERSMPKKFSMPQFGMKAGGVKVPGAQHPAWPWNEIVHVRGHSPQPVETDYKILQASARKKSKGHQSWISKHESLLNQIISSLQLGQLIDECRSYSTEHFQPPPPLLRVPNRHFESGRKLQERMSRELHTPRGKMHPAVGVAFDSLLSELSAFDRSTCESVAWAQKHAPKKAEQVLQNGREALLLRDWLKSLTIQAVDTGGQENTSTKSKATGPPKKRRRAKLGDFVVSSDDDEAMGQLSDNEEECDFIGTPGEAKKTVMKPISKDGRRLTNAVLLSGPHGCGKTATAYAIAKELNFEVFEIHAGARRAGKDILEKVGDMTRNHLVQHHQKGSPEKGEEQPGGDDDEVARDLASGKQGMMTSFFQPKPAKAKPKVQKSKEPTGTPKMETGDASLKERKKQPSKSQKQSLILLEEVDVLYEEDKQFWSTIITMVAQSKRPFIITCNDESLVPLQSLNLHGIFRFSRPPRDSAIDLLLLIAAQEGHALSRSAVQTLFEARDHDLRASITELNYWCQIGVGDPQGGVNWFLTRWPKGSDLDEEGNVIRVVSEHTYQRGMGLIERDCADSGSATKPATEHIQHQLWENWDVDLGDCHQSHEFSEWAQVAKSNTSSREQILASLDAADKFSASMSDADLFSSGAYALHDRIPIDATHPGLPAKTKEDFIIGRRLLETTPRSQYDSNLTDMSRAVKSAAWAELFQGPVCASATLHNPSAVDELQAVVKIEETRPNAVVEEQPISRVDYSMAFDPLALSDKAMAAGYLDPSVFDRTMKVICLDVAPYVRSIVAFDQHLQKERLQRSSLLSEGGNPTKKRMRTTRSALSALEGGTRANTRRERYFSSEELNPYLVLRTGGKGWGSCSAQQAQEQASLQIPSPGSGMDMEADADADADADAECDDF